MRPCRANSFDWMFPALKRRAEPFSPSLINHHRANDGADDIDGNGRRNSIHDSRMDDSKLVDGNFDIRTRDYSSRDCNSRTRNTQVHHRK
jgi:hypothetical protein